MHTDIDRDWVESLPADWRDEVLRFLSGMTARGSLHETADGWVSTRHPRWPFDHLPA